ncbi:MAG: diguanylate cyclase, partial [Bacteroidales bacterium]|nr:diguanylate cyclase [Bacteroidales bacterium]
LETSYLGMKLRSPLIVSSSGLVDSLDKIKKIDSHGAGAVVLKSLFEEQINFEAGSVVGDNSYPEAADYVQG